MLDNRAVTPAADGSPIDEIFTVSPDPVNATVYTAEIAPEQGESIGENNVFSVLVSPAGRKRRVLALEGAPGHEHGFMTRALTVDPGSNSMRWSERGRTRTARTRFSFSRRGARRR